VNQQPLQLVPILCRRIFGCHQHTEHRLPSPVIRVMHGKDDLLHEIFMILQVQIASSFLLT